MKLPVTIINTRLNRLRVEYSKKTGKAVVVNSKFSKFDIYIGRGSIWGNPYPLKTPEERSEVIDRYIKYFFEETNLIKSIRILKGKILGCYCYPLECHGDFLAFIANEDIKDYCEFKRRENDYKVFRDL